MWRSVQDDPPPEREYTILCIDAEFNGDEGNYAPSVYYRVRSAFFEDESDEAEGKPWEGLPFTHWLKLLPPPSGRSWVCGG